MYLSDTSAQSPWAHPITNTDYTLISTSQWGCRDTLHVTVNVVAGAVVDIPDSATIYPGESFQISPQTNCTNFRWFPPIGLSDSTISNPVAQPSTNTRYFVRAYTEAGCMVRDSIYIHVEPETIIDIPNAFTPGSGVNNLYMPVKRGIAKLNFLKIYNRWGVKVFETNDINTGWDGKFNGKDQPFDVYVYEVDAVTSTGKFFHKRGNVTLLR
jgi:gliding motility-associated-like protein